MRILYVCHRFPYPPKRGGKIRPFNMIRHLNLSHEVVVASLVRSVAEQREAQGIGQFCAEFHMVRVNEWLQSARMIQRLPTRVPSSMGYFYSKTLASTVDRLLQRNCFDVILVHCSSVAQYVMNVQHVPKILDFGDMDSQKWLDYARHKSWPLRAGYRLEGIKLKAEEKRLATRFDFCTTTTRGEYETLRGYGVQTPMDWFSNGVDSDYFVPVSTPYDSNTVCFVGRMDYYPNQQAMFDFLARTWPLLRAKHPALKMQIVGADPPFSVRRLAQHPGITVTGTVPDVRPYVRRAAAMVAPLQIARGTQNKLLEAMAMGVPVVTSPVAARGIDAIPGAHLLVASTPEDYSNAILSILEDPHERCRLAEAGRSRILTHHSWSSSMHRLDGIMASCIDANDLRLPLTGPQRAVPGGSTSQP